jgi:hypothetical protein
MVDSRETYLTTRKSVSKFFLPKGHKMIFSFSITLENRERAKWVHLVEKDALTVRPAYTIPPIHLGDALELFERLIANLPQSATIESQLDGEVIVVERTHREEWWDGNTCHEGGLNPTWVWRQTEPALWKRAELIPQAERREENEY